MTVSTPEYLKGLYNATRLLGDKAIASDGTMVIDGFEGLSLLIKQFPWPVVTPQGEIEIPGPLGMGMWQPQQIRIQGQGAIGIMETIGGQVNDFCESVAARGGRFDFSVYEGVPDKFYRGYKGRDAFIVLDNPDRDWESRSQPLLITGTLFWHFFGEKIPGNVPA